MRLCSIEGCERVHAARGWCATHLARWRKTGDPLRLQHRPTAQERFEAQIDRDGPGGCWNWTGALTTTGYGQFRADGKPWAAHRWAYETFVRSLPAGVVIDHLCRNRRCANPKHLDPVTNRENVMRGMSPTAVIRRQGVCKYGHEMTPENTYSPPKKPQHQLCRICKARRSREAYLRQRESA